MLAGGGISKMLQAIANDGAVVTLALLTKAEIEFHRKHSTFICPTCRHPVLIKAGQKTVPHFAHYPQSDCPSRGGGEGPYHKKGKLLLYLWLKKQFIDVALEKYLPRIKQQPDLYLKIGDKRIVIEYQCSRVDIRSILQRNQGYLSAGIIPIWILGANLFNRKGPYHLKVDSFLLQFVHQFNPSYPLTLFFFCPHSLQLVSFTDFFINKNNQAIGKFIFSKLTTIKFNQLFYQKHFSRNTLYRLWKAEKRNFRLKPRLSKFGKTRSWYQWLYLQNVQIDYLPSIIHLPISSQYLMKRPLWEWQSRLCLDILYQKKIGSLFRLQTCMHRLKHDTNSANYFPLISPQLHPVSEYLQILTQLRIIEAVAHGTYKILTPISLHRSLDESLAKDSQLMDQLIEHAVKGNI